MGGNVRRLRKLKKLTQEELAFRAGFHPSYIGLVERHDQSPSIKSLDKLAEALGTTPAELITELGAKTSDEKDAMASELLELLSTLNKKQLETLLEAVKLLITAMTGKHSLPVPRAAETGGAYITKKKKSR